MSDGRLRVLILGGYGTFGGRLARLLGLAPGGEAWESAVDGRFRFHVEIRHPWTGLIVRYRGWLEAEK